MKIFIYKPDREMFKFSSIYSLKPPSARDIILRLHVQYVDKKKTELPIETTEIGQYMSGKSVLYVE